MYMHTEYRDNKGYTLYTKLVKIVKDPDVPWYLAYCRHIGRIGCGPRAFLKLDDAIRFTKDPHW